MGKDKNAPRTKNNQKPSSSVRSAELLRDFKGNSSGFLGFGTAHGAGGDSLTDNSITQDLRLAMRKMAKKDATTKVKALQEFDELIKKEDITSIATALPFWPRLYNKLTLDNEKQVREMVQVCNGHLALKVRKMMAPYLQAIIPSWLLAMCDSYNLASMAARSAFEETFGVEKRPGVIFYCCKEIFDFVKDNLFKQTADTLSDAKSFTKDEREEKYLRVVCSSLKLLSKAHSITFPDSQYVSQFLPLLTDLLETDSFWKLYRHPQFQVRIAFYQSLCELVKCPGCEVSAVSAAVRTGLSDNEAAVVPHACQALLQLARANPRCWSELGCHSKKPVADRLVRLVSERCRGIGVDVAPLLLPLLAVIPADALADRKLDFYTKLLRAIAGNVLDSSSLTSRLETAALLGSFFDCVKFISNDGTIGEDFWRTVCSEMIGPILQQALVGSRQLNSHAVFLGIVKQSQYWARLLLKASLKPSVEIVETSQGAPPEAHTDNITDKLQDFNVDSSDRSGNSFVASEGLQNMSYSSEAQVQFVDPVLAKRAAISTDALEQLLKVLWDECFAKCEFILRNNNSEFSENKLFLFIETIQDPENSKKFASGKERLVYFSLQNSFLTNDNITQDSSDTDCIESKKKNLHTVSEQEPVLTTAVNSVTNSAQEHLSSDCSSDNDLLFGVQFKGSEDSAVILINTCYRLWLTEKHNNSEQQLPILRLFAHLLKVFTVFKPYKTFISSVRNDVTRTTKEIAHHNGVNITSVESEESGESCAQFLDEIILPEVKDKCYESQDVIVDILLFHFAHIGEEQQQRLLETFLVSCSLESLRALLSKIETMTPSSAVMSWLMSAEMSDRIVYLLLDALAISTAINWERQDMEREKRANRHANKTGATGKDEDERLLKCEQKHSHLVAIVEHMLAPGSDAEFRLSLATVNELLAVLVAACPHSLHDFDLNSDAASVCSNMALVLKLSSAILLRPSCWTLPHSYRLLVTLFHLLCNSAVAPCYCKSEKTEEDLNLRTSCGYSSDLNDLLENVVYKSLSCLVAIAVKEPTRPLEKFSSLGDCFDVAVNIKFAFSIGTKQIFSRITSFLGDSQCSFSSAERLASVCSESLMIISRESAALEDWDIPLDQELVREAFETLVTSEGQLLIWEEELSKEVFVPFVLLGGLYCRSFELSTSKVNNLSHHAYYRYALFLASVLLKLANITAIYKKDHSDTVNTYLRNFDLLYPPHCCMENIMAVSARHSNSEAEVSLGPYCRLVAVCYHASVQFNLSLQLYESLNCGRIGEDQHYAAHSIRNISEALLDSLNSGNVQLVSQVVRDMAAECQGGQWCVTLRHLLLEKLPYINVGKLISGVKDEAFNATAVKQILIRFIPSEDISLLLQSESSRLYSLSGDPFTGAASSIVIAEMLRRCNAIIACKTVPAVMDVLLRWWRVADAFFLFAEDVRANVSRAEDMSAVSCVARLVAVIVEKRSALLHENHWQQLLCVLAAWAQSIQDSRDSIYTNTALCSFVCAVIRCSSSVELLIQRLSSDVCSNRLDYPPHLVTEWREFYSNFVNSIFWPLFFEVSNSYAIEVSGRNHVISCLCRVLSQYALTVPDKELFEFNLAPLHYPQDQGRKFSLSDGTQKLLNHLVKGLVCPHPCVAGSCFHLLLKILPRVMSIWCSCCSSQSSSGAPLEEEETTDTESERSLPYVLLRAIEENGALVSAALEERPVLGGWCEVLPYTDSHSLTLGYLLAWHVAFSALSECDEKEMQDYASSIRGSEMLPRLLNVIVRLLPPEHAFPPRMLDSCFEVKKSTNVSSFLDTPISMLSPSECNTSYVIWWLASQLYLQCLTVLPYWTRTWFNAQSKRNADAISSYTSQFLFPIVVEQEVNLLKEFKCSDSLVKIRVTSKNEVVATYLVDGSELVLSLQLPPNFPLAPASVVNSEFAYLDKKLWGGWKNGLKTVLSYRNSPLIASLKVWKQNLDRKYQGIEPCYICYCIMHTSNYKLPTSVCRTCKHKFHSSCIFTWFASSPTPTCPLCRSAWLM